MRNRAAALHTLLGAYVLDAVPDRDRAEFERHLRTCGPCREDVRGLREATARLAGAAAVTPRPELREQTLQAAVRMRQLPPLVPDQPESLTRRLTRRPAPPRASWARSSGAGRRSWPARLAAGAAAILAAAAIGFGLRAHAMQDSLTAAQERDSAIAAVLGSRDAVSLTARVSTGGTATVVMSHRARALVFTANGLTRLPASKTYELWLMGPAGERPAGMLPPARHGMTGPMVVGQLAGGDRLGLTVEPSAGSPRPTSAQIVLVGLGR
jgi:anti-sigma-K factor RskA